MAEQKIVYPHGADRRILKRADADFTKEQERRFSADHEQFLSDSENEAKIASASFALLGPSREQVEKAVEKQFAANRKYVQSRQPKPLSRQNRIGFCP